MSAKPKTDLAPVEKSPPPVSESATILVMIERVLANPDFPVEKLERLFDLYQKQLNEQARRSYFAAFSEMQRHLPVIEKKGAIKNKQGDKQSGYAQWEDVVEKITPILADHGFGLSFNPRVQGGLVSVTCKLSHRDGYAEETDPYELAPDTSGSKNPTQAVGSATSYAKRYTAFAKLNIVSRDPADGVDDDGHAAGAGPMLTADQIEKIRALLTATNTEEKALLSHITQTNSLDEVPQGAFDSLTGFLNAKKKKQNAEKGAAV